MVAMVEDWKMWVWVGRVGEWWVEGRRTKRKEGDSSRISSEVDGFDEMTSRPRVLGGCKKNGL